MYDRELYSRVVRFQRTAVENTFKILTTLQGHSDKILKKSLEQMPWLPQGSKSTCMGLSDSCIHGSNNLQKIVVQGFNDVERMLIRSETPKKKNQAGTAASSARPAPAAGPKQAGRKKASSAQKPSPKTAAATAAYAEVKSESQSAARQSEVTPPSAAQAKPSSASSSPPATSKPAETPEKPTKSDSVPAGKSS